MADDISGAGLYNPVTILGATDTGLKALKVASDGSLTLTLSPGASVTIAGPLDGSGNVRTAIQNTPGVIIQNPLDGSGNVKVAVQGTAQTQIIGPLDGAGNVKVSLPSGANVTVVGPLDGSGNVKVAVQGTASVTVVGTVMVEGTVDARVCNDGTTPMQIKADSYGRIEVLPAQTYSGVPTWLQLDQYDRLYVRDTGVPSFNQHKKQRIAGTVGSTGQLDLYSDTVPTGYVWKVTTVGFQYTGTPPSVCLNSTHDGTYPYPLARYASPSSGSWNVWTGEVWLTTGMRVHWRFANATAGDSYVCYYIGVEYKT